MKVIVFQGGLGNKNCHNYPWMGKRCNNRDLIKMRQQYFFSKNKV